MNILPGFKLCRKGLHQYPADKNTCPECRKANRQRHYIKNKEKIKNKHKEYQTQNIDKVRAKQREYSKINKHKRSASSAKRRAHKKNATPPWADLDAICLLYKQAKFLSETTGIKHEVDHIYPLQSKYMCGLHVENNLQILTKKENAVKNNRKWPGQLDCQKE